MDADEHDGEHEADEEGRCPSCGQRLYAHEVERGALVCADCDLALERELDALLRYAAQVRAIRAPRDE